ncbi:MAG: hypothetical protein U0Z17_09820 [Bacteroidales bacterium]
MVDPLLVVIRMTPFDPLDPYMDIADASFNTSIEAISALLRKEILSI